MRAHSSWTSVGLIFLAISSRDARSQVVPAREMPLDSAVAAAVRDVLATLERQGPPCDMEGALPVVIDQKWRHRAVQSLVRADRGFGAFVSREIESHLPCPTALRGDNRDAAMRELQVESQPFYNSSNPRFRMAGRDFTRSLYLITGDWWKTGDGTVVVTVEVYKLLQGERTPSPTGGAAGYRVPIGSIPNATIRESLLPHAAISVSESFDSAATKDLGPRNEPSLLQTALHDSLVARIGAAYPFVVVDDTASADVVISGRVSFVTCPMTDIIRQIVGDHPSFGYRTETRLRIRWHAGRSAAWTSPQSHRCPPLQGAIRRRDDPLDAYMQARDWLIRGDGRSSVADSAADWAYRNLTADRLVR